MIYLYTYVCMNGCMFMQKCVVFCASSCLAQPVFSAGTAFFIDRSSAAHAGGPLHNSPDHGLVSANARGACASTHRFATTAVQNVLHTCSPTACRLGEREIRVNSHRVAGGDRMSMSTAHTSTDVDHATVLLLCCCCCCV